MEGATAPIDGQRPASYRIALFHGSGDIEHRLHVIDHHADADRQRGRWYAASRRQPDSEHLIPGRIDVRQNMQTDTGSRGVNAAIAGAYFAFRAMIPSRAPVAVIA